MKEIEGLLFMAFITFFILLVLYYVNNNSSKKPRK